MRKTFYIVLCTLLSFATNLWADIVLQAEDALFAGKFANNHSGYTGTGFVDLTNSTGSTITFTFCAADSALSVPILIRWANGKNDDRTMAIAINGVSMADHYFGNSGDFTTWLTDTIYMPIRHGNNRLTFTSLTSVGGPNFDCITIVGIDEGTPEPPTPHQPRNYYVAPDGDDAGDGTVLHPHFHMDQALADLEPGDTLFVRGGTYRYNHTLHLDKISDGNDGYICIFAFPNETPKLNFYDILPDYSQLSERGNARGFLITGDYYHLRGLEICNAPDNGIKVEGSHNILEQLVLHHNGDTGIQIGLSKNAPDAADHVCDNLVLNCDSYRNLDWGTSYENADGYACKLSPGANNRFIGCRAWENADDGWDFYMTHYTIYIDNCWTMGNGNPDILTWDDPEWEFGQKNAIPTNWQGDGNGFKLGGDGWAARHQVNNCIAFDGYSTGAGFSENNNDDSIFIYNCLAFNNMKNFRLRKHASDIRNCISFAPKINSSSSIAELAEGSIESNNSWNEIGGVILTPFKNCPDYTSEFISLSQSDFLAPRQPDGSLPDNGFGQLRPNSVFIDKGTSNVRGIHPQTLTSYPITLSYSGLAPDLGAYEYSSGEVFNSLPNIIDCEYDDATWYNVLGQRVTTDYHGIIITRGLKFFHP